MGKRRRLAAVVTVVALLLLAATLPGAAFEAGGGTPDWFRELLLRRRARPSFTVSFLVLQLIAVTFWSLFLGSLVYALVDPAQRRRLRKLLLFAVTALIVGTFLSPVLSPLLQQPAREEPLPGVTVTPPAVSPVLPDVPAVPDQDVAPADTALPGPLITLLTMLAMLGLAWGGFYWWERRWSPPVVDPPLAGVSRRAAQALDELRQGGQVDDVILRCYREMVATVATARGLARPEGHTPREYERQLVAAGLPVRPVRRLTRLFEQVRYGHHQADAGEREEAMASLEILVEACRPGRQP